MTIQDIRGKSSILTGELKQAEADTSLALTEFMILLGLQRAGLGLVFKSCFLKKKKVCWSTELTSRVLVSPLKHLNEHFLVKLLCNEPADSEVHHGNTESWGFMG